MDQEIKDLKSVLRSLVVSSPTQMDMRSLLRDYRSMMGAPIPLAKYGYKDPLLFLKERCGDCFLLMGSISNPVLTLIVPETLKHIDQFVQRQKVSSTVKFKGKRRSVPGEIVSNHQKNLVSSTFISKSANIREPIKEYKQHSITSNHKPIPERACEDHKPIIQATEVTTSIRKSLGNITINNKENCTVKSSSPDYESCSNDALQNFLRKRLPIYNNSHHIEDEKNNSSEKTSSKDDGDSGRQTSSSTSTSKTARLEELKVEIRDLIAEHPDGVWCTDLIRLYRERYGRELNFSRFGYTSIISLVLVLEDALRVARQTDAGDWLVVDARAPAAAAPAPAPRPRPRPPRRAPAASARPVDPDDALPGIDFDSDVFPADCMHFMESIPAASLAGLEAGAMVEVMVGEVYSPSHFWLLRLGDQYNIAMENIMDEMTKYYSYGEGRERALALGAVRVGHYCSSVYEGDWHRSLIVRVLDSDSVKVRHVDYGTVETVRAGALRPLRREWGALPAQALRARLAGARPPAHGRRWPHAAAAHFLRLVRDTRLVANVVCRDREEDTLEVFLINTSTAEDVCVSAAMVRAGHADARNDSALRTSECYLFPRFAALESGATPNYGEIHGYLRDGIALEYVEEYRRHVPACLPPALPPPTPSSSDTEPEPEPEPEPGDDAAPTPSPEPARSPSPAPAPASPAAPPSPRPQPMQEAFNRVPLMRAAPPPPPPAPPARPHSAAQYAGSPPFPGAMRLCPPVYPPPLYMGGPPCPYVRPGPPHPAVGYPNFAPCPYSGHIPRAAASCQNLGPYPPPAPPASHPSASSVNLACYPHAYPAPRPAAPAPWAGAPPPYDGNATAVTLSVSECEIYQVLSRVDPSKAQWYMADAISRAMRPRPAPAASALNPEAAEFRAVLPPGMRPPPGFGG